MARRQVFTNSLATGEIAPEYLSRSDIAARSEAAETLLNVEIMPGGGVRRRAGTRDLIPLPGDARILSIGLGSDAVLVLFIAGGVNFLGLNGALIQAVAAAPWAVGDLHTMQVTLGDSQIVVTSNNFPPQLLTKTNGVWAIAAFAFAPGISGQLTQPYYRFPGYAGVTLTPSAYTGAITLTASAPLFVPAHVGVRFRYDGIEMLVTAYTSSTVVAATVIGNLYPTILVNVLQSSIFAVGQEVAGLDSGTKGICTSIPDATHIVVQLIGGYSYFNWTSVTINEKIVCLTGTSAQGASAPSLVGSPAGSLIWDEALISPARGYPGSCGLHRTRLLMGNFPNALNVIAGSALGDITDFDVGTGLDSDAIVELIGQNAKIGVRHFGSTEQLLLFAQSGSKYVPEQVGAPLSPTNFDLLNIGPEAAAPPVPVLVAEGMLFVEDVSGRLMAAIPTGNVRRSWNISDLSELAFHLMGTPVEIGLLAAGTTSDRKVIVVRDDGALVVMSYRRGATVSGWTTWTTKGQWRSAVAANGSLYLVVKRVMSGVTSYRLEVQDSPSFGSLTYGDGVVTVTLLATPIPQYANQTMSVWNGSDYLGQFPLDGSGLIQGVTDRIGPFSVGFDAPATIALVPPIDGTDGLSRKIRICRVDVEAINSGAFTVNGYDPSGYPAGAGVGGTVGLQSGTRRFRPLGRSVTGSATIQQDHATPLEIRSITMEVTS